MESPPVIPKATRKCPSGLLIALLCGLGVLIVSVLLLAKVCVGTYREIDPLVENLLRSLDKGQYAAAMRDFDPQMTRVLPTPKLIQVSRLLHDQVGRYESRRWGFTFRWNKAPGQPMALVVVYRCRYSQSRDPVMVTVSFYREEDRYQIAGLWFNSPELRHAKKPPAVEEI